MLYIIYVCIYNMYIMYLCIYVYIYMFECRQKKSFTKEISIEFWKLMGDGCVMIDLTYLCKVQKMI